MTTERDQDTRDELVSDTYRELDAPNTPEHLNQAILRMASDDGRRVGIRNALHLAWMKPVAWAATIGLSLAIVLELTEVPTAAVRSDNVPAVQSVKEDFQPQDSDAMDRLEDLARSRSDLPMRTIIAEEEGRAIKAQESKAKLEQTASEPALEEAVTHELENLIPDAKSPASAMAAPAPAARKRSADEATIGATASFAAASLERQESDVADSCDSATRQTFESWTNCIEELRVAGANTSADREYEALILEYPLESADSEPNK
jgi:hypothetical protein